MEMSTRKAPYSRQAQDAHGERTHKISRRHYTTRRRRIKVTLTDKFWDNVWPALAIIDAVLLYTLIQIARGVL
jgi:hypothetical protein